MLEKFLSTVLPTTGQYTFFTAHDKKHYWHNDIDSFALAASNPPECNYYFALSTFKTNSRTQKNHFKSKALWMDLDLKGTDYPSFKEMLSHAAEFYKAYNLPCPTVVFSGGGFHLYWALDTELPYTDWYVLADGLHNAATAFGLQFDVKCTRDAARILRVPGSTNFKYDSRPLVRVVGEIREPSPLSAFEAIKGLGKPGKIVKPKVENKSSIGEVFSNDADADFIATNCDQIKFFKETGSDSEPHWYACANVLKHCKDGLHKFLEWSSNYDGYDEEQARAKFAHACATATGPTLCKSFEGIRPQACKACTQARNVTTPLHARILAGREAPSNGPSPELSAADAALDLPPILQPFELFNGVVYGVSDNPTAKTKSGMDVQVTSCDVRLVRKFMSQDGKTSLLFMVKDKRETSYREVLVPMSTALSHNGLAVLADAGIGVADAAQWRKFVFLHMNKRDDEELYTTAYDSMGWHDEDESFICGPWKYTANGRMPATLNPEVKSLAKNIGTVPGGNIKDAIVALDHTISQMSSNQILMYCLGIGAPLVKFTDVEEGGFVGWDFSKESGTGKSTTLLALEMSLGKTGCIRMGQRDTWNATSKILASMKNLPVTIDDPSLGDGKGITALIDSVVAGKDKNALNQDRTLRTQTSSWRTCMLAASNFNPFDHILEGQRKRRIFGFHEPVKPGLDRTKWTAINAMFQKNAGWIFHELLKRYVSPDGKAYAKQRIKLFRDAIDKKYDFRSEDRFNVAALAVALTALEFLQDVARAAGNPLTIDNKKMLEVGVAAAKEGMKTADESDGGSAYDVLQNFILSNSHCMAVVHASNGNGSMPKIEGIDKVKNLTIILEEKHQRYIIHRKTFMDWVKNIGRSPTEVIRELGMVGVLIADNRPTNMSLPGGPVLGNQRCVLIKKVETV
jgi:hypothetical protein